MDRLVIQTHNFEPDDEQVNTFKATFGHVLGEGPSDATLCCCISKESGKYVLNMRVHSKNGHFPIHTQHKDLDTLMNLTVSNMRNEFKEWHKNPKTYGEKHKLGEKPCYHADGSIYKCPLGFYSNKKFETEASID